MMGSQVFSGLAALALMAGNSYAGFELLEDFDALSSGPINGQHGWVGSGTADGRVVADPANSTNQVLAVTNVTGNVYHALGGLSISSSASGTLHFRLRWPGAAMHVYAGLTDVTTPAGSGSTADYETQVGFDATDSSLLKVRDATTYNYVATLQSNTWYRIWMVHDNPRDLYAVYLQGGAFASQVRLSDSGGQNWFTFRNTTGDSLNTNTAPQANPLLTFAIKSGSSHVGPLLVDDIYVDPTNANLSIPEPLALDTNPPVVLSVSPPADATVSTLTQLAVTFSEPVMGVQPDDFLLDDVPGLAITNAGNTYTFTVAQPAQGPASARFDPAHAITDLAGNRLDESAPANNWSYTVLDTTPPTVAGVTPAPGATVTRLSAVQVYFSEPVAGVDATDLLVNGTGAATVTGSGLGPYVFFFPQPPLGPVSFSWTSAHGIHDLSPQANLFAGGGWTNALVDAGTAGHARLNEFLTANSSTNGLRDEDGGLSGWLELFNPGSNDVNLTGWSLTDDPGDLGKWTFPALTLSPGQFLVVFASGKDRRPAGGASPLHTSFTLSQYGDYLALCPPDFPRAPAVEFSPSYPEQRNDISYGLDSANQWRYFAPPTPGVTNGDSTIANALGPVHLTADHGLFNAPFQLRLVPPVPEATIRYTTDGSQPTESTGADYTAPLTVSSTTILRAAAFRPNSLPSRAVTATYIFPGDVLGQPDAPAGFPITTQWSSYGWPSEYGMAAGVVSDPHYASNLVPALVSLPTLSVVMNVEDMFGATNGIYTHANNSGPLWERPCSIELLNPDGSTGFQADAGIQMHGGGSRARTQKHPFRVQFKGKYGPTKLQFQFFPDSPVREFDTIDLRSEYNNHWTHGFDAVQRARGTMVRDAWCKDVHAAMGDLEGHSRYVHLYINGLYWGVYNPCERPDASFGAAYLGGAKEDYDAYNGTGTQLVSGRADAHKAMLAITNLQLLAQYDLMQEYLDVTQYADYMLLLIYGANQDWGVSKNWVSLRRREPGAGFKYLCWDDERVLEDPNQLPLGVSSVTKLNNVSPDNLQVKLVTSPEYRLLFADRVQKHLFNGGVLTSNALVTAWQARAVQLDLAIVGESARWGAMMTTAGKPGTAALTPLPYPGYTVGEPYMRDVDWLGAQGWLFTNYFPVREGVVLGQLRTAGLYPTNVMAPLFNHYSGRVARGFALILSATNGIYFTTNGADPRVYGSGAIAASARRYTNGAPLTLNGSTVVKARGLAGANNWSALVEATFTVEERSSPLRISELMFNPVGGSLYEYLELLNTGGTPVALGGYSFEGVSFVFAPGTTLDPGARLVLANNGNPSLWAARYPGVSVGGYYDGSLDNAGERIALLNAAGETVCSVTYAPTNGWPAPANGLGYSLEMLDLNGDPNDPANWRASTALNGTPGQPPSPLPAPSVALNEIMAWNLTAVTNADTTPAWLELINNGAGTVNLAGWSLGDATDPRKFVFPSTNLAGGDFLVVWCEAATNTMPGLHAGFTLNKNGGDLFLYDSATNRVDAVGFGPQVADYSLGRVAGDWQLTVPTPGALNLAATTPATTNLVLNEWLANSPPGGDDWIELFNRATDAPVALRGIVLATTNATFPVRSLSFLSPRGWLQLFADKRPGPAHLDFKLPAEGGTNSLYDETGALIDQVVYGPQVEGVSEGRLPDGAATITNFVLSASPGASNYVVAYGGAALNEICALNRTVLTNSTGRTPDWVKLYNPSPVAFSLAGFALGRGPDAGAAWKFPPGAAVAGNDYLLVWFDKDRPASTNLEAELNTGYALSAGGDAVYLLDSQGLVADAVAFGPQAPDLSIGRVNGIWRLLATPAPGATNSPPATLGDASAVRFNEWLAAPDLGQEAFFELFNPSALPVDLSGLFVSDDLSIAGLTQCPIPPLSFIGPGGFTVLFPDGQRSSGPDHVNFKLNVQGESLRLSSPTGGVLDTVVFGPQAFGISEGRLPDGGDTMAALICATPGSSNGFSTLHFNVQPQSTAVAPGGSATLSADAAGFGSLSWQWFHASTPVDGATNQLLTLTELHIEDNGSYWVVVTNSCGAITSAVAVVTIVEPPTLGWVTPNQSNFAFTLTGQQGVSYLIEKSTNLVYWTTLATVTATNGAVTVRDPESTNSAASFYRARFAP